MSVSRVGWLHSCRAGHTRLFVSQTRSLHAAHWRPVTVTRTPSFQRRSLSLWPWSSPKPVQESPETSIPADTTASAATAPSDLETPEPIVSTPTTPSLQTDVPVAVPDSGLEISALSDTVTSLAATAEPTLQSLGYYGWGPRGLLVMMHETLHLSFGLSWVPTLIIGALITRAIVFPFMLKGQRTALLIAKAQPKLVPIQNAIEEARAKKDTVKMSELATQYRAVMTQEGANPLAALAVPLVQFPVAIGQFMAVRRMCEEAALPSMKDTGVQNILDPLIHTGDWLKDLTVPDPLYILPIASVALINLQLWYGSKDQDLVTREASGHMLNAFRLLSWLSIPILSNLSTGVNLAVVSATIFTVLQTVFLRIPAVRRYFGLLPTPGNLVDKDGKLRKNELPKIRESIKFVVETFKNREQLVNEYAAAQQQKAGGQGKKGPQQPQRGRRW